MKSKTNFFQSLKKNIWIICKVLIDFFTELILFIFLFPAYITNFLKGLRIFSQSYAEILSALDKRIKSYKKLDLKIDDPNEATKILIYNLKEIKRLQKEQEKKFNQFFGIFIATIALIVSIIVLIIK